MLLRGQAERNKQRRSLKVVVENRKMGEEQPKKGEGGK